MRPPLTARLFRWLMALFVVVAISGCATLPPRNVLPEALVDEAELINMPGIRVWGDATERELEVVLASASSRGEAAQKGRQISNMLAISGGAEDGAFGAGLLVGWGASGTRPRFDYVTGVSAGALIAPFAFLGAKGDKALREIFTQYGQSDILTANVLPGLFGGSAVADSKPLARLIEKYADRAFLREIARERRNGRMLLIGTTNIDAQRPVVWDMGRIAMSEHPEALSLFRKVLLASASIPGAFPPVRFKVGAQGQTYEEMHVDGGITQQVFLAPSALAFRKIDRRFGVPTAARRLYIIRNGKVTPEWQPVEERVLPIAQRSISTLTKHQGIGDLYRMYAATRRDGIDYNLAAIPADFTGKSSGPFDRAYMVPLFALGQKLGRTGYRWLKAPPGLNAAQHD
ncbi:patatin-like phospholipase family protein [Hyphomicrobium sp. CS1GBMeth3]|uniref:patatin-like phospholipase family protein n=1 Tax=Hyphomicrobium sp. CS1GBMeth3 TaxID=1892845 RepID=UPI000931F964|nr:patatin-like phospholipase family protein [Hyphomicrobium sp. CS1GBMeth3]